MLPIGKPAFTGTSMSYCPVRTVKSIDKSKILKIRERYDPVSKRMIPVCFVPSITLNSIVPINSTSASVFFTAIPDENRNYTVTFNSSSIVVSQSPAIITGLTIATGYSVFVSYYKTDVYPNKLIQSNTFLYYTSMPQPDFLYYSSTGTSITVYFSNNSNPHLYVASVNGSDQEFSTSGSSITITGLTSGNTYQVNMLNRGVNGNFPDSSIVSYKMKTYIDSFQSSNPIIYQTLVNISYSQDNVYDTYYLAFGNKVPTQQLTTNPADISNLQPNTSYTLYEFAYDHTNTFATLISSPINITTLSTNYPVTISYITNEDVDGQTVYSIGLNSQPIYSLYVIKFQNSRVTHDNVTISSDTFNAVIGSYPDYTYLTISTPLALDTSTSASYIVTVTASGPNGIITVSDSSFTLYT